MNHFRFSIFMVLALLVSLISPVMAAPSLEETTAYTPQFSIVSVIKDTSVTISTTNFPADDAFTVTMGAYGTLGVGGIYVGTQGSGNGTFTATYPIPDGLKGVGRIAIRLESPTSGYYSYNYFYNSGSTGGTGGPYLPTTGIPTFSITSVVKDSTVTIKTNNFAASDTYKVLMGAFGTAGIGGIEVTTWNSGTGGVQTATFNIPDGMKGAAKIAIRLESSSTGYYANNWFYNNSTGATGGPVVPSVPAGYNPSFSIKSVVRDGTVTITTYNFPANDSYTVYMGAFGTAGVGGYNIGTWNSGTGGTQTATFNIPDGMKGAAKIAIRLQSPGSGYYAYNWFYNNTAY